MRMEWNALSDELQVAISIEAMKRAAQLIAGHAEVLAAEIESGTLADRGGPDALRLFANLVRVTGDPMNPVGSA